MTRRPLTRTLRYAKSPTSPRKRERGEERALQQNLSRLIRHRRDGVGDRDRARRHLGVQALHHLALKLNRAA